MKRFLILIAVMFLALPCFGATNIYNDGYTTIDATGVIDVNAFKSPYQVITTNDTLTAVESGIVTIADTVQGSTPYTVTLPAAALGLVYTVGQSSGGTIYLDTGSTLDTITYGAVVLDAGDKLASPGATGDSITVICPAANTWVPIQMKGVWTDGGA